VKVFLSSTKADLEDFRNKVYKTIKGDHAVSRMEDFPSAGIPPLDFCLNMVDDAEALVLLIGFRYGTRAPEVGISYTEAEYERAKKRDLPVLPYIRGSFDSGVESENQSATDKASLRALREQVESEQNVRHPYFVDPSELANRVAFDLRFLEENQTLRPSFGRRPGVIGDNSRYARGATWRASLRLLSFPVTLVNLANMDLRHFPDDRGGRLVNKLLEIEEDLRSKDVQASIFNSIDVLQTSDERVLEQRKNLVARLSAVIVCFSKTSEDIDRLLEFSDVQDKLVVWRQAGTELPAGITPMYANTYTADDLQRCRLRIDAQEHLMGLATQRLFEEMSQ
jgi:hypothetical protein